jgi:hypothetical protein
MKKGILKMGPGWWTVMGVQESNWTYHCDSNIQMFSTSITDALHWAQC